MVDRILIRDFDITEEELALFGAGEEGDDMERFLSDGQSFEVGGIVSGKVIEVVGDQVVVDVGYKSEGLVHLNEWDEGEPRPQPGDAVEVLLEGMEDETGEIVLSRRKAHRMRAWEMVISKYHEGDVVRRRGHQEDQRAACSSTSASTSSCPPARSTSAARPTSATTSAKTSSA